MKNRKEVAGAIDIVLPSFDVMRAVIVGQTPFVCNRQSEKVKQGLLHPPSAGRRKQALKHDPIEEYRSSPYRLKDEQAPTLIAFTPTGFKRAMASAALDIPGAKKAQIGRLVRVSADLIPMWGVPKIWMATIRESGFTKAPDVRTRAIIPNWATVLDIAYPPSLITERSIANLLAMAGLIIGVGDGRNEKGALSFGAFRVTDEQDPEYLTIRETGAREAQEKAFENPEPYDDETAALLEWFNRTVKKEPTHVVA